MAQAHALFFTWAARSLSFARSARQGDCSFHAGWTQHAAPRNGRGDGGARSALAFSFVDADARLLDHNTSPMPVEDELSWAEWVDAVYDAGGGLDHPLLPLVHERWPRRAMAERRW